MLSNHEAAFKAAVAERERQICVDLLRTTPDLTLVELQRLSTGDLGRVLSTITIAELIGGVARPSAPSAATAKPGRDKTTRARTSTPEGLAPPPASTPAKTSKPKEVETRTPAGRRAYDEGMLAALREMDEPVGVGPLMDKVGGSNLQARAALNRLIAQGKITWAGKARGTRYMIER